MLPIIIRRSLAKPLLDFINASGDVFVGCYIDLKGRWEWLATTGSHRHIGVRVVCEPLDIDPRLRQQSLVF